jgi:hypothetical protein
MLGGTNAKKPNIIALWVNITCFQTCNMQKTSLFSIQEKTQWQTLFFGGIKLEGRKGSFAICCYFFAFAVRSSCH